MSRHVFITLVESFLSEEHSSNPLGEEPDYFGEYVESVEDLSAEQLENAFIIVEPFEHVGFRSVDGVGVRASINIAWIVRQITGARSFIVPAWKTGIKDIKSFSLTSKKSMGVIFEGGEPLVHEPQSFPENFTRDTATAVLIEMMMAESPFLSICLSHQLVAHAHGALLKRAVEAMKASDNRHFSELAERINDVGSRLNVLKGYGVAATGWHDETFATAKNESSTCGHRFLHEYNFPELEHVPEFILEAHASVARRYDSTIDSLLTKTRVKVESFHGNEVAEEAIQFFCWAYRCIHELVTTYRVEVAVNRKLSFLLGLPIGVEITSSTRDEDEFDVLCEVASTAIYWSDRQAQTVQFHPELDDSLLTASEGWKPDWSELTRSDGARLLMMLLKNMLESPLHHRLKD